MYRDFDSWILGSQTEIDITVDEYEDEIYNLLDPIEEDERHK